MMKKTKQQHKQQQQEQRLVLRLHPEIFDPPHLPSFFPSFSHNLQDQTFRQNDWHTQTREREIWRKKKEDRTSTAAAANSLSGIRSPAVQAIFISPAVAVAAPHISSAPPRPPAAAAVVPGSASRLAVPSVADTSAISSAATSSAATSAAAGAAACAFARAAERETLLISTTAAAVAHASGRYEQKKRRKKKEECLVSRLGDTYTKSSDSTYITHANPEKSATAATATALSREREGNISSNEKNLIRAEEYQRQLLQLRTVAAAEEEALLHLLHEEQERLKQVKRLQEEERERQRREEERRRQEEERRRQEEERRRQAQERRRQEEERRRQEEEQRRQEEERRRQEEERQRQERHAREVAAAAAAAREEQQRLEQLQQQAPVLKEQQRRVEEEEARVQKQQEEEEKRRLTEEKEKEEQRRIHVLLQEKQEQEEKQHQQQQQGEAQGHHQDKKEQQQVQQQQQQNNNSNRIKEELQVSEQKIESSGISSETGASAGVTTTDVLPAFDVGKPETAYIQEVVVLLVEDRRMRETQLHQLPGVSQEEVKALRISIKKQINTALNQLASTTSQVIRTCEGIRQFMRGLKTHPPDVSQYFMAQACERLLQLTEKGGQISTRPSSVWAYAFLIRGLIQEDERLRRVFRAHVYATCCYAAPFYYRKKQGMSVEEFRVIRGQRDGEDEEAFFLRMVACLRLWLSFLIASHKEEEAWSWLARFLNLNLVTPKAARRVCACAMVEGLKIAGPSLLTAYGRQFRKVMDSIQNSLMPLLLVMQQKNEGSCISMYVTQLRTLVSDYYANNCTLPEPEGKAMKMEATEASPDV